MAIRKFLPIMAAIFLTAMAAAGAVVALDLGAPGAAPLAATPVGTAFSYQGRLEHLGSPANGSFDFQFALFDAATGGAQAGGTVLLEDAEVAGGLFTASLDFGAGVFTGDARWLEISVRPGAETGAYTLLTPRQALTPTPYALALPGFYTQPNATSPNVIGGWAGNQVDAGVAGATIGGGGAPDDGAGNPLPNRVTREYATVSGGLSNTASGFGATVGGGDHNSVSDSYATVGGGERNTSSGVRATVGGGAGNSATGFEATVGGGLANAANRQGATVGGGFVNTASGSYSTIAGGGPSDPISNPTTTNNRVTDDYGTIGGGGNNQAGNAAGDGLDAQFATVSGGSQNTASGGLSAVSGGFGNTASGGLSSVGGGASNSASNTHATVGGGVANSATGRDATVGGGAANTGSSVAATVAGGQNNTASADFAAVAGGAGNTASGVGSTAAGGEANAAGGDFSFAAGRRTNINTAHDGAFLFADSNNFDFTSAAANEFAVRATGGVRFVSGIDGGTGAPTAGVRLLPGASAWSALSDRNAKTGFAPVDGQDVLERLAQLPLETWSYKAQDPSIRHMGPMAQDFHAAFGLGEDPRLISTLDADGVALAAIQALYHRTQEQEARIAALEAAAGPSPRLGAAAGGLLPNSWSGAAPWLAAAGALMAGLALGRRRQPGGQQ